MLLALFYSFTANYCTCNGILQCVNVSLSFCGSELHRTGVSCVHMCLRVCEITKETE